jgi:transposase
MTNHLFKAGVSREQASLLPARVEDYVSRDNPVRAIDCYVCALALAKLGFRHAERGVGVGQPPYDPADLLKLIFMAIPIKCAPRGDWSGRRAAIWN